MDTGTVDVVVGGVLPDASGLSAPPLEVGAAVVATGFLLTIGWIVIFGGFMRCLESPSEAAIRPAFVREAWLFFVPPRF